MDYDTVEANTVTLRERDSMAQVRPKAAKQNELVYVTCTKALHGAFPSHDGELYACFVLGTGSDERSPLPTSSAFLSACRYVCQQMRLPVLCGGWWMVISTGSRLLAHTLHRRVQQMRSKRMEHGWHV